nr:putative reverse transcriptase domain-containing protein [Tanacetum cinerariifolium]
MVTNSRPPKGKMSPGSTIWERVKGSCTVEICPQKCHKCNKVGHFARDCRSSGNANVANAQRNNGENPKGNVISCSKAQEYMAKGCQIFLAQIFAKKKEDMSEGKQLEDVPIVCDFPEVFPKDLPGLPPTRPVEFHIDLILRAALVARAPYRLALSEMKELLEQLQSFLIKAS